MCHFMHLTHFFTLKCAGKVMQVALRKIRCTDVTDVTVTDVQ